MLFPFVLLELLITISLPFSAELLTLTDNSLLSAEEYEDVGIDTVVENINLATSDVRTKVLEQTIGGGDGLGDPLLVIGD